MSFKSLSKKTKIITFSSIAAALVLIVSFLLTLFLFIIPENRQNSIKTLIKNKQYDDASSLIIQNGNYGETSKLYTLNQAGISFESGDYVAGIEYSLGDSFLVTITYDADGGITPYTKEFATSSTIENYAVKTGYTFAGWVLEEYTIDPDYYHIFITLKANYTINTYTITYEQLYEATLENAPTTYTVLDVITLPQPTLTAYEFIGWTGSNGEIPQKEVTIKNETSDKTYYAWFEPITYNITYDLDGGSASSRPILTYNYETKVTFPTVTKTGYTFLGWTGSNGEIPDKDAFIDYESYGDKHFKANWSKNDYKINYILNDGELENPVNYYSVTDEVVISNPTKTGYSFAGWVADGNTYQTYTIAKGSIGDITLEATWTPISYNINLELNGGSISEEIDKYTIEDQITLPNPTKTGYTFLGWTGSNGDTPQKDLVIYKGTTEEKTYTANFEANTYKITYVVNGGTIHLPDGTTSSEDVSVSVKYDEKFKAAYILKTYYSCSYWSLSSGSDKFMCNASYTYNYDHDITITPDFEPIKYGIDLKLNGGTLNNWYIRSYSIESNDIKLPTPVKTGYTFTGWTGSNGDTPQTSVVIESGSTGYKAYTANYVPTTYTITYDVNGGTLSGSDPTEYTIESEDITLTSPTKVGYTFSGWCSDKALSKASSTIPSGSYGNKTFYAKWSANKNVLTLNSSDTSKGSVTLTSGSGYSGETITVKATPSTNCTFKGWYYNDVLMSSDATYSFTMPTNNYTLTGKFMNQSDLTNYNEQLRTDNGTKIYVHAEQEYDSNSKYVYFTYMKYGLYPQTVVQDEVLISQLEKIETTESCNGYYKFDDHYYQKTVSKNSMKKFNDGTKITNGKTYWFKCEPIDWRMLSTESGDAFLFARSSLDASCFSSNESTYDKSDIRKFLINDFYKAAFGLSDTLVQTTEVDNSAATTCSKNNPNVCDNTFDKVFLLSYQDFLNTDYNFATGNLSASAITDYARCRGAIDWYCTRSLYDYKYGSGFCSIIYGSQGKLEEGVSRMSKYDNYGVRPAINITVSYD